MRALNRALGLLLGLALLVVGAVLVAEVASAALGRPAWVLPWPRWTATLRMLTFADPPALAAFAALATIALLLLVAEARPWPAQRLALDGDPSTRWWLERRALERHLASRVASVSRAKRARVRLRPRRREVDVRVRVTVAERARKDVAACLQAALSRLGVSGHRRIRIRLDGARRVA